MLPGNMHFLKPVPYLPRASKDNQNPLALADPGCAEGRALEAVGGGRPAAATPACGAEAVRRRACRAEALRRQKSSVCAPPQISPLSACRWIPHSELRTQNAPHSAFRTRRSDQVRPSQTFEIMKLPQNGKICPSTPEPPGPLNCFASARPPPDQPKRSTPHPSESK